MLFDLNRSPEIKRYKKSDDDEEKYKSKPYKLSLVAS